MSRNYNTIAIGLPASLEATMSDSKQSNGRWTKEEHQRFVDAIKVHGKNWKKVEECVGTRTGAQVRSHAQKYFLRLEKEVKIKKVGQKNDKENVKSIRKVSDDSISTNENHADNLSECGRVADDLKANLPFHEDYDNATEASENTRAVPSIAASPLLKTKMQLEDVTNTKYNNTKTTPTVNIITAMDALSAPVAQQLFHHQSVFLELMNYFSKFNKTSTSLKLSDFVDLSCHASANDENDYELPVGGKKVKKC